MHSVGLLGWGISPSLGLYLQARKQTQSKIKHISMARVGFEPTTAALERTDSSVLSLCGPCVDFPVSLAEIIATFVLRVSASIDPASLPCSYMRRLISAEVAYVLHSAHALAAASSAPLLGLCRRTVTRRLEAGTSRGGPSAWGLGVGIATPHRKKELVTKQLTEPRKM
jgi:hypothetical protein